ncbi:MAG: hypothetical protein ACXU9O_11505 [Gemmatimonadaceae bacterium]
MRNLTIGRSLSHWTILVFLLTAWTVASACAARSPESLMPAMTPQEVLASRVACDSLVAHAASMGQHVYRKSEVDVTADLIFQNRGPKYPDGQQPAAPPMTTDTHEAATVRSVVVVDSTGQPDTTIFQSIAPVPDKFLISVKVYLPNVRYKPARLAGRAVAECVDQTFAFVLGG